MSENRKSSHTQRMALKARLRAAMSDAGGGACFAHSTRVSAPTLSKYGSIDPRDWECHLPIDVLLDLDLELGKPAMLSAIASVLGFDLVPVTSSAEKPCVSDIGKVAKSSCDLQVYLSRALEDGHVCRDDAQEMLPSIQRAQEVLRDMGSKIEHIISEGD